tara:strand:- start:4255 stop:5691 length:1437 start_codon:yes stop_codon:yes gene_type:complete
MAKSISRRLADSASPTGAIDGTLSTAAQTNITSVGTLSALTVSGAADFNGSLDVDGTATFNSNVAAATLTATNGVLNLDDDGSHNGVINVPAGLFINIDSDASATNETFRIAKDRTGTSGGTELFRVQEDGSVGIGTSSPTHNLTVGNASASDYVVALRGGVGGFFGWDDSANTTVLQAPNTRSLSFQVNSDTFSAGTEAMRIHSSGHVTVGTTDDAPGAGNTLAGVAIRGGSDNRSFLSANANYVLHLNRNTSDGVIQYFAKNGSAMGSIGVVGGNNLYIHGDTIGLGIGDDNIYPTNATGASTDGVTDIGDSTARFKDIYLSGGVNFSANANAGGMTSELLDDYETGTWTPTLAGYYGTYGMSINQGTRSGYYTKVGNLVTLSIEINNAGVATSGNGDIIVITGLPFSISTGAATTGSHVHTSIATLAGGGWTSINTTQLGHLGNNGTSSGVWTWLTGGNVSTAGVGIRVTISYRH